MSKFFSALEQHIDNSWWYHGNKWTFDSREEAEAFVKRFCENMGDDRPTRIYEHDEPLLDELMEYLESDTFGFSGLIYWEKGKDVRNEYRSYNKRR